MEKLQRPVFFLIFLYIQFGGLCYKFPVEAFFMMRIFRFKNCLNEIAGENERCTMLSEKTGFPFEFAVKT